MYESKYSSITILSQKFEFTKFFLKKNGKEIGENKGRKY